MKTYKIEKAEKIKKAQTNGLNRDESSNKYTVRSMLKDLSKWEGFLETLEQT